MIVDSILKNTDIIVAHNAKFDRAFVDRYSSISPSKIWACTINDIDWFEKGFSSQKQELLCYWHGFYFEAHRAMNDVDALIQLLVHPHYGKNRPILELIKNARKLGLKYLFRIFHIMSKKRIKLKVMVTSGVRKIKYGIKRLMKSNLILEKKYLSSVIYNGEFNGHVEEIDPNESI